MVQGVLERTLSVPVIFRLSEDVYVHTLQVPKLVNIIFNIAKMLSFSIKCTEL